MSKYVIQFVFISLLALSCKNSVHDKKNEASNNTADKSDSITTLSYSYLSDNEVERLIDSKSNQFLSAFWPGMSEKQCLEVLRYLIDKEKCVAQFYNNQGDYEDIPSKDIKSVKLISKEVGYVSSTSYKFLYRLRSFNKLLVFEMNFDFGADDSLIRITLIDANLGNMDNLNLADFDYFIELYSSKYGKPKDKTFKSTFEDYFGQEKDYRRYRFLKNGVSIEIEYHSAYEDKYGNQIPCQIVIYYSKYTGKHTTYEENRQSEIEFKEEQKELAKKRELQRLKNEKEKTLKEI